MSTLTSTQGSQSSQSSGSSTSQTIIPGAAQNYAAIASGVAQGYAGLSGQVVGGLQNLYNAGMEDAKYFGTTERQQIINAYMQEQARQQQGLINRGLGNATVQASIDQGLLQAAQLNLTNADQQAAMQRLQTRQALGLPIYQAQEQIGLQGMGAQERLGAQYLNMVAQQAIHIQSFTQQQTSQSHQTTRQDNLGPPPGLVQSFHNPGFGGGRPSSAGTAVTGSPYSQADYLNALYPVGIPTSRVAGGNQNLQPAWGGTGQGSYEQLGMPDASAGSEGGDAGYSGGGGDF